MVVASSIIYSLRQHCYTKKAKRKTLSVSILISKKNSNNSLHFYDKIENKKLFTSSLHQLA